LVLFSISNWSFTSCSVINHSGQILSRGRSLSHVTPVYTNKGTASDITTFRPIALTCVLCYMMEKKLWNICITMYWSIILLLLVQ
jgi:hypothetical protein